MNVQDFSDLLKGLLNPLDISLCVCFCLGAFIGLKKGFSEMFFSCIKNLIVLTVTLNYLYPITDILKEKVFFSYETTLCVVFSAIGLLLYIVLTLLFFLLKKLLEIKWVNPFHSIFGGILGSCNVLALFSMLFLFFTFFPSSFLIKKIYKDSFSGYTIARGLVFIHNRAFYLFPAAGYFDGERFLSEIDIRLKDKSQISKKEKESL